MRLSKHCLRLVLGAEERIQDLRKEKEATGAAVIRLRGSSQGGRR